VSAGRGIKFRFSCVVCLRSWHSPGRRSPAVAGVRVRHWAGNKTNQHDVMLTLPLSSFMCRNVFYRERAAGMYGPYPMAIAQGNVEMPYLLVQTIVCEFGWTLT
jgi:hypothetical protein